MTAVVIKTHKNHKYYKQQPKEKKILAIGHCCSKHKY
jgi:hypothetical protein